MLASDIPTDINRCNAAMAGRYRGCLRGKTSSSELTVEIGHAMNDQLSSQPQNASASSVPRRASYALFCRHRGQQRLV
jgi:hypothetical protein